MFSLFFLLSAILAENLTFAPLYGVGRGHYPDFAEIPIGSMLRIGYLNTQCSNSTPLLISKLPLEPFVSLFAASKNDYDVSLVLGGYQDSSFQEAAGCFGNISRLTKFYKDVIVRVGVQRIEFLYGRMMEENVFASKRRAAALSMLKNQSSGLKIGVSLSIEDLTDGLLPESLQILQFAKIAGFDYDFIDLRVMGEYLEEKLVNNVLNAIAQIEKLGVTSKIGITANVNRMFTVSNSHSLRNLAENSTKISYLGLVDLNEENITYNYKHARILTGGFTGRGE